MLERLAAGDPVEPLKTLADVVEPATFGQRIRTHKYSQLTPLNRLVDAARPESDTAREFAALVDRMDRAQMRIWLTRWRDNDASSPMLKNRTLRRHSGIRGASPLGRDRSRGPRLSGPQRAPTRRLARSATCLSRNAQEADRGVAAGHRTVDRKAGQRCGCVAALTPCSA